MMRFMLRPVTRHGSVYPTAPPLLAPALLACALLTGCQLIGALAAKGMGSPAVPAKYVPKNVPTLILSEHSPASGVDDVSSEDIGRRTALLWEVHKLAPLIDLSKLEELQLRRPADYATMSTAAIGLALGAKQVLYIDVRDSRVESAGGTDTIRAKAAVRVRMVDVATGATLWPTDAAEGYALDSETDYAARGEGVSDSSQFEAVRSIIADKIVKLFYKHQPDN
jgi:hypothetical protein